MAKYRGGVIGLGWMGMLYDLAARPSPALDQPRFDLQDPNRPTPTLDTQRAFPLHEMHTDSGLPTSYAEAMADRPDIDLVAAADRDPARLATFTERYGAQSVYTDAAEMLRSENLDLVAIATNIAGRADLTLLAVEHGAKGIVTEKPMVDKLDDGDRMVRACADAGVPLSCGSTTSTHPAIATAKSLVRNGVIGDVLSIEARAPSSQHQNWAYFLDEGAAWVVGTGDEPRRQGGSDEFTGQGMAVAPDGVAVHFRQGAPQLRVSGTRGEMVHDWPRGGGWRLWQDTQTPAGERRVEMPWPGPQTGHYGGIYSLADVVDCIEGRLDEPKNSGRRVALAFEVEVALKLSSERGGARVDLPLEDRSLGINFDWFR
jgi:predicted dehydrogenase